MGILYYHEDWLIYRLNIILTTFLHFCEIFAEGCIVGVGSQAHTTNCAILILIERIILFAHRYTEIIR
jgi:hypothetical protein